MSVGSLITAARYNAIQARVANVLGRGSGQFGYGQTVSSVPLTVRSQVTVTDMRLLKSDIDKSIIHQSGAFSTLPSHLDLDKAIITNQQYLDYEAVSNTLVTNKNLIHPTQASLENKISSVRTTPWGTQSTKITLEHRVRVRFGSPDHMRHYFNAGGEIRFSANITNGTGFKTANWANTLNSIGVVRFDYRRTYAGTLPPRNIGFFQLEQNNFKLIFSKGNSNQYLSPTDPYASNYYSIEATIANNPNHLIFKITFSDTATGQVDETVNGKLTSSVSQYRPTGNYVSIGSPSYVNEKELA